MKAESTNQPRVSGHGQPSKHPTFGRKSGMLITGLSAAATVGYCAWWVLSPPGEWAVLFPIGFVGLVAAALALLVLLVRLDMR